MMSSSPWVRESGGARRRHLRVSRLHAAGPYRKGKNNLMDRYVRTFPLRSHSCEEAFSCSGKRLSPRASTTSRAGNTTKIQQETDVPPDVFFERVNGRRGHHRRAPCRHFRNHRWVHLACHGAQGAEKPFESWFAMKDGPLTLMRIIQERYTRSEFAFLSACNTAVGDGRVDAKRGASSQPGCSLQDLMGMIGTLWRVDDSIAHEVATRFYMEMFKHPVIDFEHAAEALNVAVVESAKDVPLGKRV